MNDDAPTQAASLPASQREVLEQLCDHFEDAWRGGEGPRMENYVPRIGEAYRNALLQELVAVEVQLRREAGQSPQVAEYVARFPGQHAVIDAGFALASGQPPANQELTSTLNEPADGRTGGSPLEPGDAEPSLPDRLGRYQIHRLLGHGRDSWIVRVCR